MSATATLEERLMSKVVWNGDEDECWTFEGSRARGGYGQLRIGGRNEYAHRVAYELFVGPITDGMDLDHLCRVRNCVNPSHLEPVTRSENLLRGDMRHNNGNARKTHCPKGHPYSGDNVYVSRAGKRHCKACQRERERGVR